jgi:hypothetical protein
MADMVNDAQALNTSTNVEHHSETMECALLLSFSVTRNYPFPSIEIGVYTKKKRKKKRQSKSISMFHTLQLIRMLIMTEH